MPFWETYLESDKANFVVTVAKHEKFKFHTTLSNHDVFSRDLVLPLHFTANSAKLALHVSNYLQRVDTYNVQSAMMHF